MNGPRLPRVAALCLFVAACVAEPPVEDEDLGRPGLTQPAGGGSEVSVDDACAEVVAAEQAARERLGCPAPAALECPGALHLAGATPCARVDAKSVELCVAARKGAASCGALEAERCLVTLVADSCTAPEPPEAGAGGSDGGSASDAAPDSGAPDSGAPDSGAPDDSGGPDGGPDGAPPDASTGDGGAAEGGPDAAPADAAPPDAADAATG